MSKNPNRKPNDNNNDEDNNNDVDNETLRRGCYVKTHKACDESSLSGGGMELDIQSKAEISRSEKKIPTISMVVYYCYLEVYIIRYTYRTGNNNTINISTNSNNSF